MIKIVTAAEMGRIERLDYAQGASDAVFMENAGREIARLVDDYIASQDYERKVTLLVGKGNNGGDAFAAGIHLLKQGFSVYACHPFDHCSPLCTTYLERFKQAGGSVSKELEFPLDGIILDGLVGTGFEGKAEGMLAHAISSANAAGLPIVAIDIPSGLDGNTGEVGSVAIHAAVTIALGLPKLGFFIGSGWNHVGEIVFADFGLSEESIADAQAEAYLIDEEKMGALLPPIKRNRHKYEAGYVLGIAGSYNMPGAAHLSVFAALRSGAGVARLFYREAISGLPPEIIAEELSDTKRLFEEMKRADAVLIGPGLGRDKDAAKLLKTVLPRIALPTVVDADALYFLAQNPGTILPPQTILTPHHQEMLRLLHLTRTENDKELHLSCQIYVEEKNVTLVLKGAPTIIFHPKTPPVIVPRGDAGMATAGSGDVLTGVIAALLAQGAEPHAAAILGVYLHALAGEASAFDKTPYGMIASDIIAHLPDAFTEVYRT